MDELNKNSVEIYRFPTDDETVADINNQMNVSYYILTINEHFSHWMLICIKLGIEVLDVWYSFHSFKEESVVSFKGWC